MKVLVTGGCGYIGSHMVRVLLAAGHRVSILDNLQAGAKETVPVGVDLVVGDVRDRSLVPKLLRDGGVQAVFHFAARIQVGQSVTDPRLYFRDNLVATIELLESVLDAGVTRFILSSTAAVY